MITEHVAAKEDVGNAPPYQMLVATDEKGGNDAKRIASVELPQTVDIMVYDNGLYRAVKITLYASFLLELLYGYFTAASAVKGADKATAVLWDYLASPSLKWSFSIGLSLLAVMGNVTSFSPDAEAKKISQLSANDQQLTRRSRWKNQFTSAFYQVGKHPLTIGLPIALASVNFLTIAWSNIDTIYDDSTTLMGDYKWFPFSCILALGVANSMALSGQDVLESVDFFKPQTNYHPQEYLLYKIFRKAEIITPIIVFIESTTNLIVRAVTFASIAGDFIVQIGKPQATGALQILGGIGGFGVAALTRYRCTYEKYYGNQEVGRLDLVTAEQRKNVKNQLSWKERVSTEIQIVLPLGTIYAAIPAYFTYLYFPYHHIAWLPASGIGSLIYFCYRRTEFTRQLNLLFLSQHHQQPLLPTEAPSAEVIARTSETTVVSHSREILQPSQQAAPWWIDFLQLVINAGSQTVYNIAQIQFFDAVLGAYMPSHDLVILAIGVGTLVSVNDYSYFKPKIQRQLASLFFKPAPLAAEESARQEGKQQEAKLPVSSPNTVAEKNEAKSTRQQATVATDFFRNDHREPLDQNFHNAAAIHEADDQSEQALLDNEDSPSGCGRCLKRLPCVIL